MDYIRRRAVLSDHYNVPLQDVDYFILELYEGQKMSGQQIVDKIKKDTGQELSPKTILRIVKRYGSERTAAEAFRLAASQGRIRWAYKEKKVRRITLLPKLRLAVMKKDNFRCVWCGYGAPQVNIEIDHIVPVSQGGKNILENLQVMCHECNMAKASEER